MDSEGKLCSKWQSRIFRWPLSCICWSSYLLYRSFVVGQIKYDRQSGTLIIQARNILTIRISLILKVFLLVLDKFGLAYIYIGIFPLLPVAHKLEQKKQVLENLVEAIACHISFWYTARLYSWLHSLKWNRSFVRLANEVISVMSLVEGSFGFLPLEGMSLLFIYVIELDLTLLQLINYIRVKLNLFVLNNILLEVFYNAYVAYLLLVLSWLALFNRFLENYPKKGLSTRQKRRKILHLLHLYSRISKGHQNITVLWLPVGSMVFSSIVIMVCHWAAIINIVMCNHDLDMAGKWHWIVQGHLGGGLAPFLRLLLIGLCSDRLAQLERILCLHLLIVDLSHSGSSRASASFARKLTNLQTCLYLQLRAQPIRNPILSAQNICGCPFVLELFLCIVVNALSYVQYGMSIRGNVYNFQQPWHAYTL